MNGRLKTGRYFFRLFGSRLCFLKRGQCETMAVLKADGKDPVSREVLTMSVMKDTEKKLKQELGQGHSIGKTFFSNPIAKTEWKEQESVPVKGGSRRHAR